MMIALLALALLGPVDVTVDLEPVFDSFVQESDKDDESSATELKIGYSGAHAARSFLTFDTGQLAGRKVTSASLKLWNQHSWSCQSRSWEVWEATPATPTTRWPGPGLSALYAGSIQTLGYGDGCGDGWVEADVTVLAQRWAAGRSAQGTLALRAADEADSFGWKRFASSEDPSHGPVLTVAYH